MSQVSDLMHLRHPLPAYMARKTGYTIIANELLNHLAHLDAHPIQTLDSVLVVNTTVLPGLLYRCKCYILTGAQLQGLSAALQRFVFAVSGLPSLVAKKTQYTHYCRGGGLGCLLFVYPTRVLDSLDRNPLLAKLRVSFSARISVRVLCTRTLCLLRPTPLFEHAAPPHFLDI